MTNNISVWEDNFRQSTDENISLELARLSAQIASVNASNNTKAPLDAPTFTGVPTAPVPSPRWSSTSNQLLTQQGHARAHPVAVWQYASGAAQTVGAAWSVFNQAGTLTLNTGSHYTLGAGGLGIVIPETGVYQVQMDYQYVVITHPANDCRILAGLSFNGAVSVILSSDTVTNLAGVSYGSATWTGTLNTMNLRGMVFAEGGASLSVTPRSLTVHRIG